jgi:hypothetical protein
MKRTRQIYDAFMSAGRDAPLRRSVRLPAVAVGSLSLSLPTLAADDVRT